jgi:hypothetical protein
MVIVNNKAAIHIDDSRIVPLDLLRFITLPPSC